MRRGNDHMRKLRENYAKLPKEKQRAMGYATITKVPDGTNTVNTPPEPKAPKMSRETGDAARIQERLKTEEAEGMERKRGFGGLAGLKLATRTDTDAARQKNRARR